MKSSLSHLPKIKQEQILQIAAIIKEVANPEKIILYGSYANGNYVEHRYTGRDGILYEYISDYDFLVVTKENRMKDYELEDIITSRTQQYKVPINLQIHEVEYINKGLEFGQYFFYDIIKEGISLYENNYIQFAEPRVLTTSEMREISQRYFDRWFTSGSDFLDTAIFDLQQKKYKTGAFILHQSTENFYNAVLLVFTGYKPKTHSLYKLRKQAKLLSEELFYIFPIETDKREKSLFDLLKRGYIDARYKEDYIITKEELTILIERVTQMQEIVKRVCKEKISSLD